MRKVVGILGGMGPAATVDLFGKIVAATPADRDQDHIHIIIDNNPDIPDRTACLRGDGTTPVPAMVASVRRLAAAGADFFIIPCNTAHAFMAAIAAEVEIPFISMVDATVEYIRTNHPAVRRVGLLATDGTIGSQVYAEALTRAGVEALIPSAVQQSMVMRAIYPPEGVKAGKFKLPRERLLTVGKTLITAGAELVILGCTEIPLVVKPDDLAVPVIDPTEILAKKVVAAAWR